MHTDHVNNSPTLSIPVYIMPLLFSWFCLIFWLYLCWLPYLEMCTDHVNSTPTLLTTVYMSILFLLSFPNFLVIFLVITILGNAHRPCKLYLNIINKYTWCLSSFSWFFPDSLIIFALITILGSAHRPCKQHPKIITTIPIFFLILLLFFM